MKLLVLFLSFILIGAQAMAQLQAENSSGGLGIINQLTCSTGFTCTVSGANLTMTVDPTSYANDETIDNTVDDTINIASNDSTTILKVTGFEASDAILELAADEEDDTADLFSLHSTAANTFLLKNGTTTLLTSTSAGALSLVGSVTGDGGDALSGFLQARVLATATTITAAQCGSTFYNGGAVQMELPEASTVLGCRLTFITANASNFDVNPDNADQILVQTDAAGDAMRNATLGNSITIEAISASQWAPVSVVGTWSDIN